MIMDTSNTGTSTNANSNGMRSGQFVSALAHGPNATSEVTDKDSARTFPTRPPYRVFIEIRRLLGSAYLYLRNDTRPLRRLSKVETGKREIRFYDDSQPQPTVAAEVLWPEGEEDLQCSTSPLSCKETSPRLYVVRLTMGPRSGLRLLKFPRGPAQPIQSWSLRFTWPEAVTSPSPPESTEERAKVILGRCDIGCRDCGFRLHSGEWAEFIRVRPLPSVAWEEFAEDWFCGCIHHGSKSTTSSQGEHASNVVGANMTLPKMKIAPKQNDLLFGPGFVVVHEDRIKDTAVKDIMCAKKKQEKDVRNNFLSCANCGRELGHRRKSMGVTLWNHAVNIANTTLGTTTEQIFDVSAHKTFHDLFFGVLSEVPAETAKIFFASSRRTLQTYIMEQQPDVYVGGTPLVEAASDNESQHPGNDPLPEAPSNRNSLTSSSIATSVPVPSASGNAEPLADPPVQLHPQDLAVGDAVKKAECSSPLRLRPEPVKVVKLLFHELQTDEDLWLPQAIFCQELNVTEDVLDAGLEMLTKASESIPQESSYKGFRMSVLHLDYATNL